MMLGLTAVAGMSIAAPATSPFNYNFVEGELVNIDVGRGNDLNGLRVKGSFDVAPAFSVVGSVMSTSGSGVGLQVLTAGGAYHQSLPAIKDMPFDLVIRAELEHVSYDFKKGDDSETGILISGGLQLAIIDDLQLFQELAISDNDYRDLTLKLGMHYDFAPHLAATAAVEVGDIDVISAGLRYSF